MSYNGSGTFQINTSGQPVVTGTVISSSAFNALTADLATGLSTAITKDGQTATTVRIPFAQGINSSLTTDTTSGSTGSIYTAGGVGITKGLFVGGTATFSATPIFSALTASSAVATDASKNLVSVTNTGTGNNVLSASPTLTGTIAGASLSLSSLTASSAVATDASKNLVSVTNTGTGSNVLNTAPTISSLNITTALTLTSASGTSGQVLTSAGSGLAPTWGSVSSTAITNGTSNVTIASSNGAIAASTNGTSALNITTGQILQFNSGYGSVATAYGCRAWISFDGTGTPAIRGSGNISSITDNGTGDYTLNFSTALPDANYAVNLTSRITSTGIAPVVVNLLTTTTPTASLFRICTDRNGVGPVDPEYVFASVFR